MQKGGAASRATSNKDGTRDGLPSICGEKHAFSHPDDSDDSSKKKKSGHQCYGCNGVSKVKVPSREGQPNYAPKSRVMKEHGLT